jgi:putative ABC transport system substrate-binding protein
VKKMRKAFAVLLAACLVAAVLSACGNTGTADDVQRNADNAGETYKIGILQFAEHPSLDNCREGFIEGLKQEGFVEGENVTFDYQNSQADTNIANQIAQNFVSGGSDLICAIATPAAQAAYNAAQESKTPVIYSAISDPVTAKLVGADGKSGLTVTGTSDNLPVEKQLAMIRELLPDAKKIGILYTLSEVNSESQIKTFKELAPKYGFEIVESGVTSTADIPLALDSLLKKVDCLNNLTDNTVVTALATVLDKSKTANIPVFGSEIEQVKAGTLQRCLLKL